MKWTEESAEVSRVAVEMSAEVLLVLFVVLSVEVLLTEVSAVMLEVSLSSSELSVESRASA